MSEENKTVKIVNEELLPDVERYVALKKLKEETDEEMKKISEKLKDEMNQRQVTELRVGIYKVRNSEFESNRFDTKSFKEQYEKLYEDFIVTSTQSRFTVTL